MRYYKYRGTGNNGTFSWLMQRITGVVLLVFITMHFFGMVTGTFDGLVRFVMGCLLAFAVWHGVNGIKMITDDYVSNLFFRWLLFLIYWVVGVIIFVQGLGILP